MTVQKKTKRGRAPPREIWLFFKQQTHSPSCHLTVCAPQTSVTWQWLLNEGQSNYIVQSVTFLLLIGITDFARLNAILNSNTLQSFIWNYTERIRVKNKESSFWNIWLPSLIRSSVYRPTLHWGVTSVHVHTHTHTVQHIHMRNMRSYIVYKSPWD